MGVGEGLGVYPCGVIRGGSSSTSLATLCEIMSARPKHPCQPRRERVSFLVLFLYYSPTNGNKGRTIGYTGAGAMFFLSQQTIFFISETKQYIFPPCGSEQDIFPLRA